MFVSHSLKNWLCLPGLGALQARRELAGRQASPARAATGLAKNSGPPRGARPPHCGCALVLRPRRGRRSLSSEGTGGARKALLPPG